MVFINFFPAQHEAKEKKKKSKSSGGQRIRGGGKAKGKGGGKKSAINTEKIDVLLDMIKGADVTSEENVAENETLLELEGKSSFLDQWDGIIVFIIIIEECKNMRPFVEETIGELQRCVFVGLISVSIRISCN